MPASSSRTPAPRPSRERSSWPGSHTGRPNVIAFYGAFHGRSLGSLSLTSSKAKYRSGFGIVTPGSYHAPFAAGSIDELDRCRLHRAGAVPPDDRARRRGGDLRRADPGRGRLHRAAGRLARELRDLCDRHGILLVMDEVQSGIGRTGTMWAVRARRRRARHHHRRQGPRQRPAARRRSSPATTIMAVGARQARLHVRWQPGRLRRGDRHARPRRAANWPPTPATVGEQLLAGLRDAADRRQPLITEVRGRGLMIGFDLPDHDTAVGRRTGVLRAWPAGAHVRPAWYPARATARGHRGAGRHRARRSSPTHARLWHRVQQIARPPTDLAGPSRSTLLHACGATDRRR